MHQFMSTEIENETPRQGKGDRAALEKDGKPVTSGDVATVGESPGHTQMFICSCVDYRCNMKGWLVTQVPLPFIISVIQDNIAIT